jgi:hypothetical protein
MPTKSRTGESNVDLLVTPFNAEFLENWKLNDAYALGMTRISWLFIGT